MVPCHQLSQMPPNSCSIDSILHKWDHGGAPSRSGGPQQVGPPLFIPYHTGFDGVPLQRRPRPPFIQQKLTKQWLCAKHWGARASGDETPWATGKQPTSWWRARLWSRIARLGLPAPLAVQRAHGSFPCLSFCIDDMGIITEPVSEDCGQDK